jgi:hypothetical protein
MPAKQEHKIQLRFLVVGDRGDLQLDSHSNDSHTRS